MRLAGPIDLAATLHGGQAFRWSREGETWRGAVAASLVTLRADGAGIIATGAAKKVIVAYLRLEPAHDASLTRLRRDAILAPAIAAHAGLRLLRQDPWETTIAFITSANNNVLRIEGILRAIAKRWGEPLSDDMQAFPPPEKLARATDAQLRACGLGYRAPFVRASAKAIARGDVDLGSLRGAPLPEIRDALLPLPGVGPKVADCIALFSLDADDAFPMDRWMLRAMGDAFFGGVAPKPREAVDFAAARWGRDAGLAQQFLFHAVRMGAGAPGTVRLAGK